MNLTLVNKKLGEIMLVLTVILFLWVSIFGLLSHMNVMKMEGATDGCLFGLTGETQVCPMNLSEHLSIWKEMFTSLPQNIGLLGLLILAVVFIIIFTISKKFLFELYLRAAHRLKLYIKQNPQINIFNYLREVFSSGILNPKIYTLVNK